MYFVMNSQVKLMFDGVWVGMFSIDLMLILCLMELGDCIFGLYCYIFQRGNCIDCFVEDEYNLSGVIMGNCVNVKFDFLFGGVDG